MDSDDPSGLPNTLQPLPDQDQARKGRGLGEAPHRCAGPEGHTGRAGRFPRRSLQHGPGPRPAGQSTAAGRPAAAPEGRARPRAGPPQTQVRSAQARAPARPADRAPSPARGRGLTACPAARPRHPRVAVPGRRPPACPRR